MGIMPPNITLLPFWAAYHFMHFSPANFPSNKAASCSKQIFLAGRALLWSFNTVLRLNRELGGVWRLRMMSSTHWGGSRTFSRFGDRSSCLGQTRIFVHENSRAVKYREIRVWFGQTKIFVQENSRAVKYRTKNSPQLCIWPLLSILGPVSYTHLTLPTIYSV